MLKTEHINSAFPLEDFISGIDFLATLLNRPIFAEGIPYKKKLNTKKINTSSPEDFLSSFCDSFDFNHHITPNSILLTKKYSNNDDPLSISVSDISIICKQILSISQHSENISDFMNSISKSPKIPSTNIGISENYDLYALESPFYANFIETIIVNNFIRKIKESAERILNILKSANSSRSYFLYEQHTNNPNFGLRFHFKYQGRDIIFPMSPADIIYWNYDGAAIQKIKLAKPDSTDPDKKKLEINNGITHHPYDEVAFKEGSTIKKVISVRSVDIDNPLPEYILNKKMYISNNTHITTASFLSAIRYIYNYSNNYKYILNKTTQINSKTSIISEIFPNSLHNFIHSNLKNINIDEKIDRRTLSNMPSLNYDLHLQKYKRSLIKIIRLELLNISTINRKILWDECNDNIKDYIFQIFFIDLTKNIIEIFNKSYVGSDISINQNKYLISIDKNSPEKNYLSLIEVKSQKNGDFKSYTLR